MDAKDVPGQHWQVKDDEAATVKRCVAPEFGGCGKVKSLDAFSVSGKTSFGEPVYRPRCKLCMCAWSKRSKAEKAAMQIQTLSVKVGKDEKQCYPVEKGGCGRVLPITDFHYHKGYHKPRCRFCMKVWKEMTVEERRPFVSENMHRAVIKQKQTVSNKPAPIEYDKSLNYFFHIPATNCERSYQATGLQL